MILGFLANLGFTAIDFIDKIFAISSQLSRKRREIRLSLLIELLELSLTSIINAFGAKRRFHKTSKKAYNYFYFSKRGNLKVQRKKIESSHLACRERWLRNQLQCKNGADK